MKEMLFASVSFLPFTKKFGKSSYDVIISHYDVTLILFLFRIVTNVQDL